MALANFFDKAALSAYQVLKDNNREKLVELLSAQNICIYFDQNAANSTEGKLTLDLIVRLIARLYPIICFDSTSSGQLKAELTRLAQSINLAIDFGDPTKATVCIAVGTTALQNNIPTFYVGSQCWVAGLSIHSPIGSSNSNVPFGAGAAACFAAANLFRLIFKDYLPFGEIDKELVVSLLDSTLTRAGENLIIPSITFNQTALIGLGAIGNAAAWAFKNSPSLKGSLEAIDDQTIDLSNLQRYVLAEQSHIGVSKVDSIHSFFQNSGINILKVGVPWNVHINSKKNWEYDCILSAVDNSYDRRMIQGALPKKIFNAWTQLENIGISSHTDFLQQPCLCCLYMPQPGKKSLSQEMADNLNCSHLEQVIRKYLANHYPVDLDLLQILADANSIPVESIQHYLGHSLQVFYSEVVCGGILMRLTRTNNTPSQVEVPCAFESAIAGIVLIAEFVKNKMGIASHSSSSIRFNLLRPISSYIHIPESKNTTCICNDPVYKRIYTIKWVREDEAIDSISKVLHLEPSTMPSLHHHYQ
jgi:hypothetical protein